MAQSSRPDPAAGSPAGALTEAEWERVAVRFSDDGVYGDPNDPAVVVAGVGLNVTVRAERRASVRGYDWYAGTVDYTHTINTNVTGSTRIDRVVLRLDRSNWTVRSVVRSGTAGAGAPALQQDTGSTGLFEIPLAQVTVVNNASSVTVAREELWVGSRIRPCTSSTRPLVPKRGEQVFETDTGKWMGWDGSAWRTIYEDTGPVVANSTLSAWSNDVDAVVQRRSGNVHLRLGAFTRASSAGTLASATDSRLPVSIPSSYRHASRTQYGSVFIGGGGVGVVTVYPANDNSGRAGQVWLTRHSGVPSGQDVVGPTISWVVT